MKFAGKETYLVQLMGLVGSLRKGQSTNFRVEDELPLEAQSIVLPHDNDIVSATRNSRYT